MSKAVLEMLRRGPLAYPFLFAIYPILFLWSSNIEELSVFSSPADLLLPMAVSVIITSLLLAFFWAILRDWRSAGIFVAFILLLFFSYGYVLETVTEYGNPELAKNRYLMVIWPVIFAGGGLILLRFRSKLTDLTNPLNVMSFVLVVFTLPATISYSPPTAALKSEQDINTGRVEAGNADGPVTPPDIWYITAEGYSSARTLQRNLNFDNSPFINYLKSRNFYVASESNSTYHVTNKSLASSLNMQTIQQFTIENPDWPKLDSHYYLRIRDSKAMRFARQHGYRVVYLSDRFAGGSKELGDIYFGCGSRRLGIHREGFVDALLMTTALNPVLVQFIVLEPKLNDRRVCDFFQLAKAREVPGPKVVVVHLKVPGYPFVIGAGGEVINSKDSSGRYEEAFVGQLAWTNKRFEWLIDILLSDPEYSPVIVIQGDHGEPAGQSGLNDTELRRAQYGIMNAYHLPNGGDSLLYPSVSPINTFRIIFNYYLGADFELLEDKSYSSPRLDAIDLTDVVSQGFND